MKIDVCQLTTVTFKCLRAIRKLVLKHTGGVHQIFGGGVPFVVMCFRTLIFQYNIFINLNPYPFDPIV